MSLMELGRRVHANEITLEDALREMKDGSCSVLLNCWSKDDGQLWECSWIVGGKRYTHLHQQPRTAILGAIVACTKAFLAEEVNQMDGWNY